MKVLQTLKTFFTPFDLEFVVYFGLEARVEFSFENILKRLLNLVLQKLLIGIESLHCMEVFQCLKRFFTPIHLKFVDL